MFAKKKLFSLLFFFLFLFAHAQQDKELFPLKVILVEISAKHHIKFNFVVHGITYVRAFPHNFSCLHLLVDLISKGFREFFSKELRSASKCSNILWGN